MKIRCLGLIFLVSFMLAPFLVSETTEYANAKSEIEENLTQEITENLDALVGENLNEYFQSLEGSLGYSLKDFVKGIINGEIKVSAENVLTIILQSIKSSLKSSIASVLSILTLAILSSLAKTITAGFKKDGIENIIHFAIYGAILCALAISLGAVVKSTYQSLVSVNKLLDGIFPILISLVTALGGVSAVTLLQPTTLLISNLIIKLILNLIIPTFCAIVVLTFVGNMSNAIKLDKLSKTLKSIANWSLGITFSIVTTFTSIQGLVGASFDSISIKSAKFALSSYIPILGGYLSEGFDIVMASCVLIKNALGLTTFLILLGIIVAPTIKILIFSFSLKLVSSIVEPLGETKTSNLLYDTAGHLNLLIACIGGVAFIVFIIISITIGAFNGGII